MKFEEEFPSLKYSVAEIQGENVEGCHPCKFVIIETIQKNCLDKQKTRDIIHKEIVRVDLALDQKIRLEGNILGRLGL